MNKFVVFKKKEKFTSEGSHSGNADPSIRPVLTELINKAADDFQKISEAPDPTEKKYQEIIKIGLDRFSGIYITIDTEDRERICSYFEALMDLVGVESSGGALNDFMYGFDPNSFGWGDSLILQL